MDEFKTLGLTPRAQRAQRARRRELIEIRIFSPHVGILNEPLRGGSRLADWEICATWTRSAKVVFLKSGGRNWIRTSEGVSQQIYSLPPLATWVSYRPCFRGRRLELRTANFHETRAHATFRKRKRRRICTSNSRNASGRVRIVWRPVRGNLTRRHEGTKKRKRANLNG
jgi:hypothetical protein